MVSELISALLIAVVQGLTEWMPISSSGHLILAEKLLGYSGGLMFDVALHFGTLMAVFVYFGGDIVDIVRDLFLWRWNSENGRLGILIVIATIPAAIAGYLLRGIFEEVFHSLGVVALGFGVTGLFLLIASVKNSRPTLKRISGKLKKMIVRGEGFDNAGKFNYSNFSYGKALLMGIAQAFALFPGVSRSGATISSGLLLGLKEKSAMKFSFLMSIPIIFGANILVIGNKTLPPSLVWATMVSFVVGLLAMHVLYNWVLTSRRNLRWFGIYALLVAIALGIWVVLM